MVGPGLVGDVLSYCQSDRNKIGGTSFYRWDTILNPCVLSNGSADIFFEHQAAVSKFFGVGEN